MLDEHDKFVASGNAPAKYTWLKIRFPKSTGRRDYRKMFHVEHFAVGTDRKPQTSMLRLERPEVYSAFYFRVLGEGRPSAIL